MIVVCIKSKGCELKCRCKVSLNEYKYVLLNKKCLRHSINRIQSKGHRTGTFEINKMSLSCFDDKGYIQNNGYDGLTFGYQSEPYI